MSTVPRITDTEWEIMRVIWAKNPISAFEVIARLSEADPSWHPKTARALLARLVKKEALGFEAHGRVYFYRPRVSEQQAVAAASESFLQRVFGGAVEPMLAHFVKRR